MPYLMDDVAVICWHVVGMLKIGRSCCFYCGGSFRLREIPADYARKSKGKKMKDKIGILVGQITAAAIVVLLVKPITASCALLSGGSVLHQRTLASDAPQLLAQGESLSDRLRKRQEAKVAEELEKNPKLLDDPNYLAQHPKLADYLQKHPEAKPKLKQDPKGFFKHLEDERSQGI